jgi:hypothetical protein
MKLPLGVIVFASGRDAERLVAGVPAAARSVREARRAGLSVCWVTAGAGWEPSAATRAEIDRLADGMDVHFGNGSALAVEGGFDRVAMIPGDRQPTADAILRAIAEPGGITQADLVQVVPQEEANQVAGRMTAQVRNRRAGWAPPPAPSCAPRPSRPTESSRATSTGRSRRRFPRCCCIFRESARFTRLSAPG